MINNQVVVFDISFYQDNDYTPYKVDFSIMKSNGGDGVILRAGQNVWIDEDYLDYVKNADNIKFPRGAYWFYDSRTNPTIQADLFADVIEQSPFPALGLWGDYEETYGGSFRGQVNFKTFLDRLKERFPGKSVGVYTAPSYWIVNTTSGYRVNFKSFPVWIAHYKVNKPEIPLPWDNYVFWQYTAETEGKKFGVESNELDTNVFGGSLDDYKRYFLLEDYVPAEPSNGGTIGMYKVWSTQYNMTVRNTNAIGGTGLVSVPKNTVMQADRIEPQSSGGLPGDRWAHVTVSVNGISYTGWVAIVHNGVTYCNYELIVEPTPTGHVVEVFIDGVLEYRKEL